MKFVKENWIYFVFCSLFMTTNILYCLEFGNGLPSILNGIIIASLAIISIIFYIVLLFFEKENVSIENRYLFLILVIGIIFLFAIPMTKIPDEYNHFLRAYEISEGHIISTRDSKTGMVGRELTNNLNKIQVENYSEIAKVIGEKTSLEKHFYIFPNTALHSFVCYIPQVIGILVGKILNLPILIQAYLGRISNFVIYILITYFALKNIPTKKYLFAFLLLLPISIQEATSLSADALTNAVSFAFISFVFYEKFTKEGQMSKKEKTIMIILPILIAMCKIVYLPICLLLFLIPKERFGSLKNKNIMLIGLATLVITLNLLWTSAVSGFLDAQLNNSSPKEQLEFILNNPDEYILIMFRTFRELSVMHIRQFMGEELSLFNVWLFSPYIDISIIVLCVYLLENTENDKEINKFDRALMIFIMLSVVLLIYAALYIQWTSLKYPIVEGVQGRYYIPISLILGVCLYNKIIKTNKKIFTKYAMSFILTEGLVAALAFIYVYI